MATSESAVEQTSSSAATYTSLWIVAVGWLFPGMGYFVQKKFIRGGLVLISVAGMFWLGLALRGELYTFNTGDVLQMLGFVGDVCAGLLYFFSRMAGGLVANHFSVMGDYGTKFLIASGLLNILAATDARDVALGRKR